MKSIHRLIWIMAASACVLAAQVDPPGRVAHLSYVYGSVSFRPGDVDEWYPAEFNRPLTTGDHVYVDFAGTAELLIGNGALRLGSQTTMDILNLDDYNAQVRLSEGTLIVRIRYFGDQDNFEIDTPNLAFSLLRPGEYRVDVRPDSSTTIVTVRGGEGELNGPNQAFTVRPGQQVWVSGGDQPRYQTYGLPPRDVLDNFAEQRDLREDNSVSGRYCSREMVGYADLDRFGSWRETPEYGMVWAPDMPVGWAPYHYGHWVWVDPWGWTWVDDARWGFAPFHFGRWAFVGYWAWIPGPVAQRPIYAPALVAWVGSGAIGGGIGWFPLGPREVYVPSYRTSPAYVNRVNVTNTVIVNNINITNVNVTNVNYVNRGAPGAVMAVQQNAFENARPVQSAAIPLRPEVVRTAPVIAAVAVAPTRASIVRAQAASTPVVRPREAVETAPVIARRAPPPPPLPFVQKQAALTANAGRPLDAGQVQQLRQVQPPLPRPVRQVQARQVVQAPASSGAPPQIPPVQPRPGAQAPPPQAPPVEAARPGFQGAPPRSAPPAGAPPVAPAQPSTQPPRPQPQFRDATPPPQRVTPTSPPPPQAAPQQSPPPQPRQLPPADQRPATATPPPQPPSQPRQIPPAEQRPATGGPPERQGPPPAVQRPAQSEPPPAKAAPKGEHHRKEGDKSEDKKEN